MAISTLSRLTVPLDSNASASNQGLLMPKLQYRFRVSLENFGTSSPTTELTKQVIDVTRPNVTFDQMTVDIYNSRVYLAGKHTWEPITINFREDVSNNVQKLVGEQLQKQFDFFEMSSAASGSDYKFVTRIDRNELYLDIAIEPVKAVEFIYIPLRLKNTGEIAKL